MAKPIEPEPPVPLSHGITEAALAFRGYNVTNLGRTPELLAAPPYAQIVRDELQRFGAICAEIIRVPVNLVRNVEERREYGLDQYAHAVALVVAVEYAQLRLLREIHGIDYQRSRLAFGYSLGEVTAVCCTGAMAVEELLRVPLELARDCAELAHDTRLAVLFSRDKAITESHVQRLCVKVTSDGQGVIGMSAVLSPNTYLLVGQRDTMARFKAAMENELPPGAHLRLNDHRWPPLHTPIVRQRHVPDRAAVMLESMACNPFPVRPAVVSLVSGKRNYDQATARELLRDWADKPQRLWDAVCETLAADVKTVLHVGPEPNVVPATFTRLAENVRQQTGGRSLGSYSRRAMAGMAGHPWLASLVPARAALLRAPFIVQINLEDWLLENIPQRSQG